MARRFLQLFEAHGVERSLIPRLVPQIRYADIQSEALLLGALTPEVIDATATLFGVRRPWLEGVDDLVLTPSFWRGTSHSLLNWLERAEAAAMAPGAAQTQTPLRMLTTSRNLGREYAGQQWLVPVVVAPVADLGDGPIYRCLVSGDYYDWADPPSRLELQALIWLAHHRLKSTVPMYRISLGELQKIRSGVAIPSVVLLSALIAEPSLEDFMLSSEPSRVTQETGELPALLKYLAEQGLHDFAFGAPMPPEQELGEAHADSRTTQPRNAQKPTVAGKQRAARERWESILIAAQTLWAEDPTLSIAAIIPRLRAKLRLSTNGFGDSAMRKHLRTTAPPGGRGKPGRKPKKLA